VPAVTISFRWPAVDIHLGRAKQLGFQNPGWSGADSIEYTAALTATNSNHLGCSGSPVRPDRLAVATVWVRVDRGRSQPQSARVRLGRPGSTGRCPDTPPPWSPLADLDPAHPAGSEPVEPDCRELYRNCCRHRIRAPWRPRPAISDLSEGEPAVSDAVVSLYRGEAVRRA
jgi:hypothetical protein